MLTEVPSNMASTMATHQLRELYCCDVALLVFDPSSHDSLAFALEIEAQLPATMPRVFVGTKEDECPMPYPEADKLTGGEFAPPSPSSPLAPLLSPPTQAHPRPPSGALSCLLDWSATAVGHVKIMGLVRRLRGYEVLRYVQYAL